MSGLESEPVESESFIPITSTGLRWNKYSAINLLQYGLACYLTIFINFWYVDVLVLALKSGQIQVFWWVWVLLPLSTLGNIFLFPLIVLLITKVIVAISFHRHPAIEGVFHMDSKDRTAWELRQHAMLFAIWLARAVPMPWIDKGFFSLLGVRVRGSPVLYDSWVDTELLKFGRDNMLSLNAVLFSHMIIPGNPRKFLIKEIKTSDF